MRRSAQEGACTESPWQSFQRPSKVRGSQNNFGIIPDIHSAFLRATDDCLHPEAYNAEGLVGG
jgi:hypothetical protein